MILRFDSFTIDTDAFELTCDGEKRRVEPLVFDLIAHFASHPDRVFSRDELIDAIWGGRAVSDSTVATCVKSARKALGDSGENQTLIQTVRGRGFKFIAEVSSGSAISDAAGGQGRAETSAGDPSLLIFPFRYTGDDPRLHQIAERLGLDVGTILTRVPLLRHVSPPEGGSDGSRPAMQEVYAAYGVDFVVDGSLQQVGDETSANVQLSDARGGYRLWAESFTLNEAVDDLVAAIVGKLEPQLHRAMYAAARAGDDRPNARALFLEANGLLVTQGWHHESFSEATSLLRRSTELDPSLAVAPALLSLLTGFGARLGLADDLDSATSETVRLAEQALRSDGMDSTVLGFAGCSLADVGELERGEALLRNAIELNPANAQALVALGAVLATKGEMTAAVDYLSRGIDISPRDSRLSVWGALLAMALLLSGDGDAACEAALSACQRNDRTYLPRVALAAARLAENQPRAALRALADARRIKPDLTPSQIAALVGSELRDGLLALEATAE